MTLDYHPCRRLRKRNASATSMKQAASTPIADAAPDRRRILTRPVRCHPPSRMLIATWASCCAQLDERQEVLMHVTNSIKQYPLACICLILGFLQLLLLAVVFSCLLSVLHNQRVMSVNEKRQDQLPVEILREETCGTLSINVHVWITTRLLHN